MNDHQTQRGLWLISWAVETFGTLAMDPIERTMRFFEEAIELAHTMGLSREKVDALVDRVFSRPAGEEGQEIAQTTLCLEALAACRGVDINTEAAKEIERILTRTKEHWRDRQNAKARENLATPC